MKTSATTTTAATANCQQNGYEQLVGYNQPTAFSAVCKAWNMHYNFNSINWVSVFAHKVVVVCWLCAARVECRTCVLFFLFGTWQHRACVYGCTIEARQAFGFLFFFSGTANININVLCRYCRRHNNNIIACGCGRISNANARNNGKENEFSFFLLWKWILILKTFCNRLHDARLSCCEVSFLWVFFFRRHNSDCGKYNL